MMYGYLSGSIFPVFATFLAGSILAISYLSVYFYYTLEKRRVIMKIGIVVSWNALTLLFSFSGSQYLGITSMSKSKTGDWIGYIAAATSLLLYASPFATLARAFRTKSVATIPIALVLAGSTNSFFWSVYGFMKSDMIVAIPNAVCVFFGCIQTTVYCLILLHNKRNPQERLMDKKGDAGSISTIDLERPSIAIAIAEDSSTVGDGSTSETVFQALATPRLQTN